MVTVQVAVKLPLPSGPLTVGELQALVFWVRPAVGVIDGAIDLNTTGVVPLGMAVTVTVKVCALPTSLSALGPICTEAST